MRENLRGIIRDNKILYHIPRKYIIAGSSNIKGSVKFRTDWEEVFLEYVNPESFWIREENKYEFEVVEGKALLLKQTTSSHDVNIMEKFYIADRGIVFTLNMKDNDIILDWYKRGYPYFAGDIIRVDEDFYRILHIQNTSGAFGVFDHILALNVKLL